MNPAHGGNIRKIAEATRLSPESIIDFSANINPLGFPEWLRPLLSREVENLVHYPDIESTALRREISERWGISIGRVVTGNGTAQLMHAVGRVFRGRTAVIPVPSYADYEESCRAADMNIRRIELREDEDFCLSLAGLEDVLREIEGESLVFLGLPNNPTGLSPDAGQLTELIRRMPETLFCLDEAFTDFVPDAVSFAGSVSANTLVFRSMTKFYAVPGLRVGWMTAPEEIAGRIRTALPPWSLNHLAETVGVRALQDDQYAAKSREYVAEERDFLLRELQGIPGLKVFHGEANFLLVKIVRDAHMGDAGGAAELSRYLLQRGIAVRECASFPGLDDSYFRIAVRTREENEHLCEALHSYFTGNKRETGHTDAVGPTAGGSSASRRSAPGATPALMLQGTSSNAGKSVLAAAFCRILLQDGFRVAPFKAQNMALNSYVTKDGKEMGRAQVVQAQACRREPDVRMNPVLIKPNSEVGSQIILMGKPLSNMSAREYYGHKRNLVEPVHESYRRLCSENDVMVLEGAGSPGEINLREHDIVNMKMARFADAAVMLTGDIDRGGVFASFVGTMEVLHEWERRLVKGFIVNRFRGDESLLQPALDYTWEHTGRRIFGVVPYIQDLGIPEEDSVTFKNEIESGGHRRRKSRELRIVAVDLPHISNFTDFDALEIEPDVELRVVSTAEELSAEPAPDALIIPGTKNVISDLRHLTRRGITEAILELARRDGPRPMIIGICGGLQMLGRRVEDPDHLESDAEGADGMGLLDVTTVLKPEKTLRKTRGVHRSSGLSVSGYEIHHGVTDLHGAGAAILDDKGTILGVENREGSVWGTYLHGVFDADEFRRHLLNSLREKKRLPPLRETSSYDVDASIDRLANLVRAHVDVEAIYRLLGIA